MLLQDIYYCTVEILLVISSWSLKAIISFILKLLTKKKDLMAAFEGGEKILHSIIF